MTRTAPSGAAPDISTAGDPEADRFVGDIDVTQWQSPVGERLVDQHRKLSERLGEHGALILSLAIGGVAAVTSTFVTSRIYDGVLDSNGIQELDRPALNLAKRLRSRPLNATAATIAHVFGPVGMPIMSLSAATILAARRRRRTPLILVVAAGLGSIGMTISGKDIVRRHRPAKRDAIAPYETSPSFPSGHTLNATVISGVLAYLVILQQRRKTPQVLTAGAAVGTAGVVGLSRVLLGAHWFSDVAVGWASGSGWLSLVITSHRLYLTTAHGKAGNVREAD